MIPVPSSARVWIATGHTDLRRGMNGLSLLVQEGLKRDPHAGDLYLFRGRRGDLVKCLWHDGRRERFHYPGANGVPSRRDRLAKPTTNLATEPGRIIAYSLSTASAHRAVAFSSNL
jgi:hypothetical protein